MSCAAQHAPGAPLALIAIIVSSVEALLHSLGSAGEFAASSVVQAIQNVVFLGLAVLFLANVERASSPPRTGRAPRAAQHRSHRGHAQLTKDPDQFLGGLTPRRRATHHDALHLHWYLDYCSELLSLTSKVPRCTCRFQIPWCSMRE